MPEQVIARWETKGNDFLELKRLEQKVSGIHHYQYSGNGCGGAFPAKNDEEAIKKMEYPWGHPEGAGQVTVLKSDRPSLKRIF